MHARTNLLLSVVEALPRALGVRVRWKQSVRSRPTPSEAPLEGFAFQEVGRPSAASLGLSIWLHGIAILSLGFISVTAPGDMSNSPKITRDATTIRIGDRLYYVTRIPILPRTSTPAGPLRNVERNGPAVQGPRPQLEPIETTAAEIIEEATPTAAPRTFVPPPVKENFIPDTTVVQTLIQPLSPPELIPTVVPLPSFQVRAAPLLPPDNPKALLVPGARTAADVPPPPQPLTDPDLVRADPVPSDTKPKLALPPPIPDSKAIRVYPPEALSQFKVGDPVNILSLSDRPVMLPETLVIPPGNVAGKTGEETGTGVSATRETGSASNSKGSVKDGGTAEAGASGAAAARIIIQPANGRFDAMVIQSSPTDQFPEAKGLLTGRPIYTVYISVGSPKDWALYFCVPGESLPASGETKIVRLGGGTPVQAPYPTRIERPEVARRPYEKYILVHGFVTTGGRFERLRVIRPTTAETDQAIIASLSGWEFRSATRDGVQVAVEFLLSIPVAGL